MVIALTLLTLAIGFCLFDQDDHAATGHLVPDLCLGIIAVSLMAMPFDRLVDAGWAWNAPAVAAYVVTRHMPDPPPRPGLFS